MLWIEKTVRIYSYPSRQRYWASEVDRDSRGVPIVAVDDIGEEIYLGENLKDRPEKKAKRSPSSNSP